MRPLLPRGRIFVDVGRIEVKMGSRKICRLKERLRLSCNRSAVIGYLPDAPQNHQDPFRHVGMISCFVVMIDNRASLAGLIRSGPETAPLSGRGSLIKPCMSLVACGGISRILSAYLLSLG